MESKEEPEIPKDYLDGFTQRESIQKNWYINNDEIEWLLYKYLESACTDVELRDKIMEHASKLIEQIIKAHNLANIVPNKDDSTSTELHAVAWAQIESMLYKYDARPHCSKCYSAMRPSDSILIDEFIFANDLLKKMKQCPKCGVKLNRSNIYYKGTSRLFNLWSQVSKTVILALIKREQRDRKNAPQFQNNLENRPRAHKTIQRFILEAGEAYKDDPDSIKILDAINKLHDVDDKAHDGLIQKIISMTGLHKSVVINFFRMIRIRARDFTDSPLNEEKCIRYNKDDRNVDDPDDNPNY